MTFHSPQEPLGSCCPDSAPSSRSLLGPKGQGEDGLAPSAALSSRDKSPHLPHSRVSEGGCVCRGAAVCCVQLWFLAGARLRGRHWLSRWGHLAQPVPRHMGRQCSSSGGWGNGWACFPTLGIIPAGWGRVADRISRAGVRGPEPLSPRR